MTDCDNPREMIDRLKSWLSKKGQVLICYSGGLDSSLLASVAAIVLGDDALLAIVDFRALPRRELLEATKRAESLGLRLQALSFPFMEVEEIVENGPDRCYHCRKGWAVMLKDLAEKEGISTIADGLNMDDIEDDRPGTRAFDDAGIVHPFLELELSKADLRRMARALACDFWDRPSSACLATRIPPCERITEERLSRIEAGEEFLLDLGASQVRLRDHGDLARIEVLSGDMASMLKRREDILEALRRLGYRHVAIDLDGYRTGSLKGFHQI
ncbi:MAG: ATP-dependent sacrificial sulfur transferase LarE [Methanotrichaceae archaeon]|nr:ATP-dependent sacrificial sulfur transferase LarE [Methanotrichaceae archaeon]